MQKLIEPMPSLPLQNGPAALGNKAQASVHCAAPYIWGPCAPHAFMNSAVQGHEVQKSDPIYNAHLTETADAAHLRHRVRHCGGGGGLPVRLPRSACAATPAMTGQVPQEQVGTAELRGAETGERRCGTLRYLGPLGPDLGRERRSLQCVQPEILP